MRSYKLALLFIIHFSLLFTHFLHSSEPVPYRLINADLLNLNRTPTEYITVLTGNVHFFYDDIEFYADKADIYEKQEYVLLYGNVKAIQDTLSISSNEAQYYHQNKYLRVAGNVVITETHDTEVKRRATARLGTHYRELGEFVLQGSVYAHSISDSLHAKAGYAFYNQKTGYAYMMQNPIVWRAGADSVSLAAQKIEYFELSRKLVASFNVITMNKEIKATSNFLIYYDEEGKVVYIGDPKFYSDEGDGYADLMTVFLEKNQVKEVLLQENSYINFRTAEDLPKDSWISSKNMTLYYQNEKPRVFIATHDVKSFFNQAGNSKNAVMNNDVTGERLTIHFGEKSNVSDLKIQQRVSGKYRFESKK